VNPSIRANLLNGTPSIGCVVRRRTLTFVFLLLTTVALTCTDDVFAAPAIDVFGLPVETSKDATHPNEDALSASAASDASDRDKRGSVGAITPARKFDNSKGDMRSAFVSVTPSPPMTLPEPIRRAVAFSIVWQGRLNAEIESAAARLRTGASPALWWTLVLMSFGYGILHALGPGHGKFMVGAYIGSRQARLKHALLLSTWTATVQALSAIGIVFGTVAFSAHGMMQVLSRAAALETVGYGLLMLSGAWTLWTTLTRRGCCTTRLPVHFPRVADDRPTNNAITSARYLGMAVQTRSRNLALPANVSWQVWANTFPKVSHIGALGLAAGIRPCVGAIFVLIATIATGVPKVGVAATVAMSAGVAVTVSAVAAGSVSINRILVTRHLRYRLQWNRAQRIVAVSGALFITLYGAVQLFLLVSGYAIPSVT